MSINKKWIEALRSGKYKQTTNCLKDGNGYCCLGVGLDIIKDDLHGVKWKPGYCGPILEYLDENGDTVILEGALDRKTHELLGIDYNVEGDLVEMNDIERKSFNEIADYLDYLERKNIVADYLERKKHREGT